MAFMHISPKHHAFTGAEFVCVGFLRFLRFVLRLWLWNGNCWDVGDG